MCLIKLGTNTILYLPNKMLTTGVGNVSCGDAYLERENSSVK